MIPDRAYRSATWLVVLMVTGLLAGCGGITMKTYPTAEEQYRQAYKEYEKENFVKAIDGFQKVIYNFSGASMVDSAQYYLAQSYFRQDDYYMAAAEFERLVNTYPGSPFIDDGQYMAGFCYYKASPDHYGLDQGELERAIEVLGDFVTDNPESQLIDSAKAAMQAAHERLAHKRYASGHMYFRLGYYDAAEIYFQSVLDDYTDTEWAAKSLFYLGEARYKQKRYAEAKNSFDSFLTVFPNHKLAGKAKELLAKIDKKLAESTENI